MSVPSPTVPMVNGGLYYVNGLKMSPGPLNADNLTTGTIVVTGGLARDSTNVNDIVLPTTNAAGSTILYVLNPAATGVGQVNGLDTGTIAIDLLYAVYAIGDSRSYNPSGTLLSLNFSAPLLPDGYDMFRRIGAVLTAHAAARFVYFDQRGNGSVRDMWYAYNNLALNGGAAVALTAFNLSAVGAGTANQVPITAGKAYVFASLVADAGGTRYAVFSGQNTVTIANGGAIAANPGTGEVIMSAAASTTVAESLAIPVTPSAGPALPATSYYAVSNAAAALSVSVQGYQDLL